MEASPTLSIESFSYRWLISLKSSLESLDDSFEASDEAAAFIVMDPKMTPSKRFLRDTQDFNFPTTPSSHFTFVHADDLFSNGLLMPLFLSPSKIDSIKEDTFNYSVPTTSSSSSASSSIPITSKPSKIVISINQIHSIFSKRCWRSSKRIFKKYLGFLKPVYRKSQSSRLSTRSALVDTDWENSQQMSPPRNTISYSIGDLCDAEGSIYEAVLHCKKSIEK